MFAALRQARALIRSLRTYHGDRKRHAAMDRLYSGFISPGDLVFDVGAHVGDRTSSFRRLGASVVAVEPQPPLSRTLSLIHGRDKFVSIESCAVGRQAGRAAMMVNADNPTVSTLSEAFIAAARGAEGWAKQSWSRTIEVDVVTIDDLIARYGTPAFIKLDVEGYEAEALGGLSAPVQALSFEFTTIQRGVAHACIERCSTLGYRRFNAALGESQTLIGEWIDATRIAQWLDDLPAAANSGDVYAVKT
jgi:FkbM family methyltransferase